METILRNEQFDNGVRLEFVEGSNRYFGDYHRLRIEVRCRVALTAALFPDAVDPEGETHRVRGLLGEELKWSRSLERMGVATADLAAVRAELMDAFAASTFAYLRAPQFPTRLLAAELEKRKQARRPFRVVK
ncbi:hypothetical protein [Trichloromonas sp.]|uniref:hypothetical protein n=1 Tax=Trichloromonas sp. TaxID=3069249 RepID=UPI002A48B3C3|nr:hypothetical protein [Trichloromonas sp.]